MISQSSEVDELANRIYDMLLDHELKNKSANPVAAHEEMADIWELNLPRWCIEKSFASITKEKMRQVLEKGGVKTQTEISFRGIDQNLPSQELSRLRHRLSKEVIHDFGYGYK